MKLVSAKEMLDAAVRGHYAVGHFNLNNMESVRAFLLAAEEMRSPIILGVSGGTAKYMGGYRTISHMVQDFMDFLKITVPVALHVDHGKYTEALDAIENGFSSVMFDGSSYPIEENIAKTKEIVKLAHAKGISVEAEVGGIGGEEDGRISRGECADPNECRMIADLGIDFLAAGIGNIHGKYPADWEGLHFDLLGEIKEKIGELEKAMNQSTMMLPSGRDLHLSISGGIAWYPENSKDFMTIKKYADFAMYQAKHSSKGTLREFDPKIYQKAAVDTEKR